MLSRSEVIEVIFDSMHVLRRKMTAYCAKDSEITPAQWAVLRVLLHQESPLNLKEVAESLGMSGSAATQLVEALVKKDYLQREVDPQDRRLVKLSISKEFQKKLEVKKKTSMKRVVRLFDALSDKELARYAELNQKLIELL